MAAVAGAALASLLVLGCDAARVLAPARSLRAASASDFAVDVEFDQPLDRATAEDKARYVVYPSGNPGAPLEIYSATLVDTTYGRMVQLLLPAGLADGVSYEVRTRDVLTLDRRSSGTRAVSFASGLRYASPLRQLFAEHCDRCHGTSQAGGNYRTDSAAGLFGGGSDATPNLIASDPNCLLLMRTRPLRTMFDRGGLSYLDYEIIRNWVVSYGARL